MSQPHSLESLTTKAAPTFEQPFEMMQACHQRLDRTLALMAKMREHVLSHGCDDQAKQAAQDILRYFEQAAPNHHLDEELHVFPPLLERGDAETVDAVRRLQDEHRQMEAQWVRVREILRAVRDGAAASISEDDGSELDAFARLYESHIRIEESLAYPAARSLIGEETLREMGREMQARRGGAK